MTAAPCPPPDAPPPLGEVVRIDDERAVVIRPIELPDAFRLRRMFDRLSEITIYHRFFAPIPEPRHELLVRLAGVDHDRREALVAMCGNEIVGMAHYEGRPGEDVAEVAVTVEDAWQGRGLGTALLDRLAKLGRRRGLAAFNAVVMGENSSAVRFLRRLSPESEVHLDGGEDLVHAPLRRSGEPLASAHGS